MVNNEDTNDIDDNDDIDDIDDVIHEVQEGNIYMTAAVGVKYFAATIFWVFLTIIGKDASISQEASNEQTGGGKNQFKFSNYFKLFLITSIVLFFYRFIYLFFINLKNKY